MNELGKLFGTVADGFRALRDKPLAYIGQLQNAHDFSVQFADDVARRTRGSGVSEPAGSLVARQARFCDRRQLRHLQRTLRCRYRKWTQAVRFHLRQRRRHGIEHHMHLAADHVDVRERTGFISDVLHSDAGHGFEQFSRQMDGAAGACRGICELARICFPISDEVAHRFDGQCGRHNQHVGGLYHIRNRSKRSIAVVWHRRIKALIDRQYTCSAEHNRVAVGWRFGNEIGSDIPAGAGPVVHHDLLSPGLRHANRDRARQ